MCVHVFYHALYENIDDFLCVLLVCLYTIDLYIYIWILVDCMLLFKL